MDIKREACDIRTWKEHLFLDISSTNIATLVLSLYHCIETRCVEVFWPLSQPLAHFIGHHLRLANGLERNSRRNCEPLYATNSSHRKQETFLYEYALSLFASKNPHKRTLPFDCRILKHDRHFDCWNQLLNMGMCICYLDCHEAGLCCYLVIHLENLLRPLPLFYFNLWAIYWLPRVSCLPWFDHRNTVWKTVSCIVQLPTSLPSAMLTIRPACKSGINVRVGDAHATWAVWSSIFVQRSVC
jgi:hypothetical protein